MSRRILVSKIFLFSFQISVVFLIIFSNRVFVAANSVPDKIPKQKEIQIRITQDSKVPKKDIVYTEDDLDLKLFQGTLAALKGTIKSAGEALRIVGDTTAGITGGGLKAAGASIQGLGGSLDVLSTLISGKAATNSAPKQGESQGEEGEQSPPKKRQGPVGAVTRLSRNVAAGGVRLVGMASEELGDVVYNVGKYTEQVTSGTGNLLGGFLDGLEDVLSSMDESLDVLNIEATSSASKKKKEVDEAEEEEVPVRPIGSRSTQERVEQMQERMKREEHVPTTWEWLCSFTEAWWQSLFAAHYGVPSLASNFALVCILCYWLGWRANKGSVQELVRSKPLPKSPKIKRQRSRENLCPPLEGADTRPYLQESKPNGRRRSFRRSYSGKSLDSEVSRLPERSPSTSRSSFEVKRSGSFRLRNISQDSQTAAGTGTFQRATKGRPDFKRLGRILLRIVGQVLLLATVWVSICTLDQSNRRRISLVSHSKAWDEMTTEHIEQNVETANWLNSFMKNLWVLQREGEAIKLLPGGLGPYVSDILAESLAEQLEFDKPTSVTHLRLSECTLGTAAPVVRGVKLIEAWTDAETLHTFQTLEISLDVVAKDLSIIFAFKLSSLEHAKLPYTSIQATNLLLRGRMTITLELLPDYPFLGIMMLSFNEMPELSLSLKPLHGIDISSIPGLGTWVTMSVQKTVGYYVQPYFYAYDLESFICPQCVEVAEHNLKTSQETKGSPTKSGAGTDITPRSPAKLPGWQLLKESKSRRGLDHQPSVSSATSQEEKEDPPDEEAASSKRKDSENGDMENIAAIEKPKGQNSEKQKPKHKIRHFFCNLLNLNENDRIDVLEIID